MSGDARRAGVHVHVHTGATPDAQEAGAALLELRGQLAELTAAVAALTAADAALSDRLDVVAGRLSTAVDGDHRRRLRREAGPFYRPELEAG